MCWITETIINNKNDLIEETFCYQLFENSIFDRGRLFELLISVRYAEENQLLNEEIKSILHWIVDCVDLCFFSHKDINDLYYIKNYQEKDENNWNILWKQEILHALK